MLRIFVVSHNGSPPATPVSAMFGNGEGSIGRDEINTLVLAEPDKHLSRIQALIKCLGGEYFLLDQGGNPCIVNGRPVGKGKVATLHPGDRIKMAGWVLQVAPVAPVANVAAAQRPLPPVADKGLQKPASPMPTSVSGADIGTATVLMPEQFDQIGDARSWGSPSDFLRDFLHDAIVADVPADKARETTENLPDRTDPASLQAAFLRGLGITATADWRLTARQAELLGGMLRASMEGFQRLLKEQALSRKALQSVPETGDEGGRNPIKTSADAAIALHRMLFQSTTENALSPAAAVQDVILELHAHHAGFSLAVRGAMAGMLASFRPEVLEKRLTAGEGQSESEKNLWERYVQAHTEISRKAEGVFHSTLVQAYRRVYEDQKNRPAAGRTPAQ